jgi:hypothetical protein
MMGSLFLYRNVSATELDQMTFSKMSFWYKFHEEDNERIKKEQLKRERLKKNKRYL